MWNKLLEILNQVFFISLCSQRGQGRLDNASGRGRGRGRGRGGRGRSGKGRKNGVEKSAEELDKELENYHANADAMQT